MIGLLAWGLWSHQAKVPSGQSSLSDDRDPLAFPSPSPSLVPIPRWDLRPGTELLYHLQYGGDTVGGTSRPQDQAQGYTWAGLLHIGIIGSAQGPQGEAKGYDVLVWATEDPAPGDDSGVAGEAHRLLREALAHPVQAVMGEWGFHLRVAPPSSPGRDRPEETQRFFATLFEETGIAGGMTHLTLAGVETEETLSGVVIRQRTRLFCPQTCTGDDGRLHVAELMAEKTFKTGLSTAGSLAAEASPGSAPLTEGRVVIRWDETRQWVRQVESLTQRIYQLGNHRIQARSTITLDWRGSKVGDLEGWRQGVIDRGASFAGDGAQDLDIRGQKRQDTPHSKASPIDAHVTSGWDEDGILSEWRQGSGLPDDAGAQARYLRLKSWLALHPKTFPRLVTMLTQGERDSALYDAAIKAMAAVGSVPAQESLVALMRAPGLRTDEVSRVMTAMALLKEPAGVVDEALREFFLAPERGKGEDALQEKAELVLGAVGHKLQSARSDGDQERRRRIEELLGERLRGAKTPLALDRALAALGNLGPARLETLAPYLGSEDPRVRARAVFALRWATAPEALATMTRVVSQDPSEAVRHEAVEALAMHPANQAWMEALTALPARRLSAGDQVRIAQSLAEASALPAAARRDGIQSLMDAAADDQVRSTIEEYLRVLAH